MNNFQTTCFKKSEDTAVEKNLRVTINFIKKLYFPVITWNEKLLSKQVVPRNIHRRKLFFGSFNF